jgi:uncharacterized protein (TIGR02594 family)
MNEIPWLKIAKEYLGVHEGVGAANNPKVLELFALAGHPEIKDDATAWCAAFVGGVLKKAGLPNTGSLAARSYEKYGVRLEMPMFGCIGVKRRKGLAWAGHVGFVVGANRNQIILLGGNQNDQVGVAAFPRTEFTAFVWPKGVEIVRAELPTTVAGAYLNAKEA